MSDIQTKDLPNNGGVMYEVVIKCTECEGLACINMTDSLFDAQRLAAESEQLIVDEDGDIHNYVAAVAEVTRKVIYVPPRDEADIS